MKNSCLHLEKELDFILLVIGFFFWILYMHAGSYCGHWLLHVVFVPVGTMY